MRKKKGRIEETKMGRRTVRIKAERGKRRMGVSGRE